MYKNKERFFSPPPHLYTLFCCMGRGVLLQLYGWRGVGERKIFLILLYIKLSMYLFNTSSIESMILMWTNPLHCPVLLPLHPYSCNKTPFPIQQKSVRMGVGEGEKNLSLLLYIKLPMYRFYTSNIKSLI